MALRDVLEGQVIVAKNLSCPYLESLPEKERRCNLAGTSAGYFGTTLPLAEHRHTLPKNARKRNSREFTTKRGTFYYC